MSAAEAERARDGRPDAAEVVSGVVSGLVSRARQNPQSAKRLGRSIQTAVGLFLLIFGYWIGRDHCHLVLYGARSHGTLVGYRQVTIPTTRGGSTFYNTASMPIVEYQAAGQTVRFQDWLGSRFRVPQGSIPVLYDPARPTNAMIDRPLMNWIPWAPMMAVGLLLIGSGIRVLLSLSSE